MLTLMGTGRGTRSAAVIMICNSGVSNLVAWPLAWAPTVSLVIFLSYSCAWAGIVKIQPADKFAPLQPVSNIHNSDNQILKLTSIFSDHREQRRPSLRVRSNKSPDDNDHSSNPKSDIVRKLTEFAHIRNIHKRHKRHSRSTAPETTVSILTTLDDSRQGRQSNLISSISAPSIQQISTPRVATTMPTTSDSGQSDQTTEYATVNYNGIIGINATDPYAITTETRTFALPLEVQVSGLMMFSIVTVPSHGLQHT